MKLQAAFKSHCEGHYRTSFESIFKRANILFRAKGVIEAALHSSCKAYFITEVSAI